MAQAGPNLEETIEQGWQRLDEGKVDEARKLADRAVTTEPDSPEAHALVGAVANAEGDVDTALEELERAMELDPDYFDPIVMAAETLALAGDFKEALELAERALDVAEEEDEYVGALLLKAEIEVGDDDVEAATTTLGELPPVALPSVDLEIRAAELFLELGDLDAAEQRFTAAAQADADSADAVYGLGLVAEQREDRAAMIGHFQRVRLMDLKAERAPWAVSTDRLEQLVQAALEELPERAQKLLDNVPIIVEDYPSEEVVADGFDPRGLGLFAGIPFPEQSNLGGAPHLEAVFLFQRNIERVARSTAEVEGEIRTTLLHETGHFFGLDEEDLAELGLD
jgi:predicted Zn-dependent protease with MMP-like domain/Flp pilus assembly protein TadD